MTRQDVKIVQDARKIKLNQRLESVGWALFLIMIGGLGLVPEEQVPEGTWLIGIGLIMLGLNVARRLNDIEPSGFTIVLGVIALLAGTGDFLGVNLPVFPILLILLGAQIIYKAFFTRTVDQEM